MNKVMIRDARREDCKEIKRLIQELANDLDCPDEPELDETSLEEDGFLSKHPYFHCFVAEVNIKESGPRDIVGYAVYYFTYSTWQGKSIYLEDLYVTPNYRAHGVGSTLFAKVAEKGFKSGCKRMDFLVMDHSPVGKFYKKNGAVDITAEEGWHHYRLYQEALEQLCPRMNH